MSRFDPRDAVTDLAQLLARIEAADAPDREIDAIMHAFFALNLPTLVWHGRELRAVRYDGEPAHGAEIEWATLGWIDPGKVARNWSSCNRDDPAYTASIDAIVALIERALPGAHWTATNAAIKPRANVWLPSPIRPFATKHSSACTPALALCAAFVRAMQSARPERDVRDGPVAQAQPEGKDNADA